MKSIELQATFEPFFLAGEEGQLFSLFYHPAASRPPEVGVLYIPPFADEMNRSRRMAALQARHLASCGLGTLVVDLFGTGDSEGEFVDARWDIWVEDLLSGIRWLRQRGMRRIVLWGVRFGALLVGELSHRCPDELEGVVLWQPVVSGKLLVSQLLRLRAAADMLSGDGVLDTRSLLATLKRGETLEVAGYELHPDLVFDIEDKDLREIDIAGCKQVNWIEVVAEKGQSMSPVQTQVIEKWRASGMAIHTASVVGEPFWATPEIAVVPDLLALEFFLIKASSSE